MLSNQGGVLSGREVERVSSSKHTLPSHHCCLQSCWPSAPGGATCGNPSCTGGPSSSLSLSSSDSSSSLSSASPVYHIIACGIILSLRHIPISKSVSILSDSSSATSSSRSSSLSSGSGGVNQLKKVSHGSDLVIAGLPLPPRFFFLIFTVRFFPAFQLISHPSALHGSPSSSRKYFLVRTLFSKKGFSANSNLNIYDLASSRS